MGCDAETELIHLTKPPLRSSSLITESCGHSGRVSNWIADARGAAAVRGAMRVMPIATATMRNDVRKKPGRTGTLIMAPPRMIRTTAETTQTGSCGRDPVLDS